MIVVPLAAMTYVELRAVASPTPTVTLYEPLASAVAQRAGVLTPVEAAVSCIWTSVSYRASGDCAE